MPWVEVFTIFLVSHLVGDFLLQTEWQARCKHAGLGGDSEARRALLAHVGTYTLAFVPALIWLADEIGAGAALGTAALIALPHLVQDDGRLVRGYLERVKGTNPDEVPGVTIAVDQTFHFVALLLLSFLVAG